MAASSGAAIGAATADADTSRTPCFSNVILQGHWFSIVWALDGGSIYSFEGRRMAAVTLQVAGDMSVITTKVQMITALHLSAPEFVDEVGVVDDVPRVGVHLAQQE